MSGVGDVVNNIQDVPQTFTNWDTCMTKAYCKWPAIGAIIIGAVIVLSILWCLVSCLCLGATFCGACVKCLTCCNCCGACGRGRGGGGSRFRDDYTRMAPSPYQGFQPQPGPMTYNQSGPQFATFDAPTKGVAKVHEDSLPAMPSWQNAASRRVEDDGVVAPPHPRHDDLEMGHMQSQQQRTARGGYDRVPLREPTSPGYPGHYNRAPESDLGSQRLGQNRYDDFQSTPPSPAPTYRTHAPQMGSTTHYAGHGRSMATNAESFPANDYRHDHNEYNINPQHSGVSSTRYESPHPQRYTGSTSLPPQQSHRPPTMPLPGRKPVNGSSREI